VSDVLTHINLIRNVGRFDSVFAGANVPFQKFTLIYGENGVNRIKSPAHRRQLSRQDARRD